MRSRYVMRGETLYDRETGERAPDVPDILVSPMIRSDLPSYISPITKKPVEGRAARREDLARSGSRPVDPSEYKPVYHNKKYAESAGGEWQPRAKPDLGEGYVRRKPTLE